MSNNKRSLTEQSLTETNLRRNILKTTVFGSIAGLMVSLNPIKMYSSQKNIEQKKTKRSLTEVKIHPLAIKRNK